MIVSKAFFSVKTVFIETNNHCCSWFHVFFHHQVIEKTIPLIVVDVVLCAFLLI